MSEWIGFLSEHGPVLAIGATAFLGAGWFVVLLASQPIHKQRLAEASVIAAVLWLGLAVFPWPRSTTIPDRATIDEAESSRFATPAPVAATTMDESTAPIIPFVAAPASSSAVEPDPVSQPAVLPDSSPQVADVRAERTPIRLAPLFAIAFNVAAAMGLAALVVARLRLHRLVRGATTPIGTALETWNRLQPPRRARLLVGSVTPLSFGIWRPVVLTPTSLAEQGGAEFEAVLRHELAHIRNGDAISRSVFNIAMPILALHPVYWLLRRVAMFAAELRVDADAAEPVGAGRYVESLVALFNHGGRPRRLLVASTVWASESEFCRRMTMLLKRDRSLWRRTSWTWRTGVAAVAAMVVTLSASQFGVVYAQAAKTKNDGAANRSASSVTSAADAFLRLSQEAAKTAAAGRGHNPFASNANVSTTKGSSLGTPSAENAGASLLATVQKDEASRSWAAPAGNGGDVWNALTLQIADRKAKLTAAQVSPDSSPWQALQLELEIIHLLSAKRIAAHELELRQVENRLLQVTSEAVEAGAELGAEHPTRKKLERAAEGLRHRADMLRKMIEDESVRAEVEGRKRAERYKQETQAAVAPTNEVPAKVKALQAEFESAKNKEMQNEFQTLLAKLQSALQENAKLRNEIASLNKLANTKSSSIAPATDFNRSNLEFSAPMIRHRIRMAEAELPLLMQKLAYCEADRKRTASLREKGVVSSEESDKSELQSNVARAEIMKAEKEIESLRTLLKELDESSRVTTESPKKVAR